MELKSYTLKEQLDKKVEVKSELEKEVDVLKMKLFKLKVAWEAAEVWGRTPHPSQTVGEAVVSSVNKANRQNQAQQATLEGGKNILLFQRQWIRNGMKWG